MLTLWRRHKKDCRHAAKGRRLDSCSQCPIWTDGIFNGVRVRQTLDTADKARASRRLAKLEDDLENGRPRKSILEATAKFLESVDAKLATRKKYSRIANHIDEFAARQGLKFLDEFRLEHLDTYRTERLTCIGALTWSKELQTLRQMWEFWIGREWCLSNPAKKMKSPKLGKINRPAYEWPELEAIFAAADTFGRSEYERARAWTFLRIQYEYALRLSDVAFLRRDEIRDGWIIKRAQKNGEPIQFPLIPEIAAALESLPHPKGAAADGGEYFFWNGISEPDSHVKVMSRTLKAVFRKSGVEGAISHRFRHTLATNILEDGGSIPQAATCLGDSPAVTAKSYVKDSRAHREATGAIWQRVRGGKNGTRLARGSNPAVSALDSLVEGGGEGGGRTHTHVKYGRF